MSLDLYKQVNIKHIRELDKICMKFHFQLPKEDAEPDTLVFAKKDCIISFNFMTEEVKLLHTYKLPLQQQPNYYQPNYTRNMNMIGSEEDAVIVYIKENMAIDLDQEY